jgi:Cellulase (glycosyl hydrolase family 5)
MMFRKLAFLLLAALPLLAQPRHWTAAEANQWYSREPWIVGVNFIPSTASNELEMWQSDTFDPLAIDKELGWAESLGMNTARVFLHYLLWQRDSSGFEKRINVYLKTAERHHIKTIFVLLDSCWDPFPEIGPQLPPKPGIHNSRWVQSPGAPVLMDPKQYDQLFAYVQGIIYDYSHDKRILAWDLWNEPSHTNKDSYGRVEPANKVELVTNLLPKIFQYARAAMPSQPLTVGLWEGDWSSPDKLTAVEKTAVENSDVISFHNYGPPEDFEKHIQWLQTYGRPILCTEYMARPTGSTFQAILPIAKKYHVAAINWGLVAGKTQTIFAWDTWKTPATDAEPKVWFHDILRPNGRPYSVEEVEFIRSITARGDTKAKTAKSR